MCKVISRGIDIAPGPYNRLPTLNDAKARSKYNLQYVRHSSCPCYSVYRVVDGERVLLGELLHSYYAKCWAFVPCIFGVGSRWYLSPTRFEAINACFNFYHGDNS